QDLGVLFPSDVAAGIIVTRDFTRDPASAPADRADYYRFEVLQNQTYLFLFNNHNLLPGTQPQLTDTAGNPIRLVRAGAGVGGSANLAPGTYVLRIGGGGPPPPPAPAHGVRR